MYRTVGYRDTPHKVSWVNVREVLVGGKTWCTLPLSQLAGHLNFCTVLRSETFLFLPRSSTFQPLPPVYILGTACLLGQLDSYQRLRLQLPPGV